METSKFSTFGLSDQILKAIDFLSYNRPTQVQEDVIPLLLKGKDVIVKSETGSGKTASFAIPLCEKLEWEVREPQVLVITPTRELALQVKEDIFNIGRFKRIKVEAIFGKSSFEGQQKQLKQRCHVVVGTPGRLIDHLERGTLDLSKITNVVIDEADEMLKMGFLEQLETILDALPKSRTSILLSATMPENIEHLCSEYLQDPVYIEVASDDVVEERIQQVRYMVEEADKLALLRDVLVLEQAESCIIFANTKLVADDIFASLEKRGLEAIKLHGGMEQRDRTKAIADYKHGYARYLVATDVAARGLDIDDVALVVNFDIPRDSEIYTHRIGRSARVGKSGKAIIFMSFYEDKYLKAIVADTDNDIELVEKPDREVVRKHYPKFETMNAKAPKIKEEKGLEFKQEIMKLHINAGKKTRMRAGDIVGALCDIDGMSADDIGVISIVDVSTFVEILNNKGELVYQALQTMPIKGRVRKVNKANISEYEMKLMESK